MAQGYKIVEAKIFISRQQHLFLGSGTHKEG